MKRCGICDEPIPRVRWYCEECKRGLVNARSSRHRSERRMAMQAAAYDRVLDRDRLYWSLLEEALLVALEPFGSSTDISRWIGRSPRSVQVKAAALGVAITHKRKRKERPERPPPRVNEHKSLIVQLRRKGVSFRKIAARVGCTPSAVAGVVWRAGLCEREPRV